MRRGVARVAVGAWALTLLIGCHPGAHGPQGVGSTAPGEPQRAAPAWPGGSGVLAPDRPATWWPVATSRVLEPTGIEVVARSGVEGMAVDSGGVVWLHGPWMVARVDPRTGASSVWDVSDDVAFSEVTDLRPSLEDGVWILAEDRLRLFDGVRFVHDLPVPEQYRGGPGGVITDMVEVGTEVWVSSAAGVARCAGGAWSFVGPQQLTRATSLEVDAGGSVWSAGRLLREGGSVRAVVRFDGVRWQLASPNAESGFVDELVADEVGRNAGPLRVSRAPVRRHVVEPSPALLLGQIRCDRCR